MKIDSYILERLRADAAHTIAIAECEDAIQHLVLRGRFREILIANLLAPWLPPFCKCATGMIIESKNKSRSSTKDDILIIDPSLSPPILASTDGPEGVFLLNSVLQRIEVKSKFTRRGISDFIDASVEITEMKFSKQPDCKAKFVYPLSILVALKSDFSNEDLDYEYRVFRDEMKNRTCPDPLSGFVSAICVVDRGFWFLKNIPEVGRCWCRLLTDSKEDRLARLVAKASNNAYRAHVERQGRDPAQGLEIGIGHSLPEETFLMLPEAE